MFRFAVCLALLGLTVARQATKKEERGLDDGSLKGLIARLDESKRNEKHDDICPTEKSIDCEDNVCTYVYETDLTPVLKVQITQYIDHLYNFYEVFLDGEVAATHAQGYEDDDEMIETEGFDTLFGFFKLEIPVLQGVFDHHICLVWA